MKTQFLSLWECNDNKPNKTHFQILINNQKRTVKTCDSHRSFLENLTTIKIIPGVPAQ
ncbi:hypothetical protein [Nitrosopumilus sp.]|uniref:hypothetical protein n=1 Tax=Nitrosopumilus sp. TaxID=2024843 RepID=UPI00292FE664|nr:hypothetical protein [Nitrosopumilus sp.]